ncbi:Dynamin-3 [Dissostichus eleginoides]|uniref:Dynamin-3 n=1 Tax=Dissostichus eleginoides TaxID=100907 RepID=A0AAD9C6D2_DISEL|nr:Dynamin-3 [Dissostichus eleginoides]
MTKEVRALLKGRNLAFRSGDSAQYSAARANLKRGIRDAKAAYKRKIEDHFTNNDPRRVWQARASLSCQLCGAPSHPASACSVSTPPPEPPRSLPIPSRGNASAFNRLSPAAPPPPIIPRPTPPFQRACRLMDICSFCGGAHARSTCPHNPTTPAD